MRLTAKGEGTITAADIEAPADLEILNPELEIANLSSKGRLEITLTIGRGRGYVPAEGNRGQAHTIGVIPVDSMFSPIRRVAYDVEAARVGQRTDYDKLILDVTTDGSIDPKDAIAQARRDPDPPARDLHRPREDRGLRRRAAARSTAARWLDVSLAHGMENFPIEELELGVRSYNCLKRVGIETIGDLVTKTENELASIPNFGKKSIEEVKETLAQHGLRLRGDNGGRGVASDAAPALRKKLGRDSAHRKALYANLAGALIEHGRIKTTVTKAKAVKPIAEQMITLGRRGDLHARRQAIAVPALEGRRAQALRRGRRRASRTGPGGYTRIVKIGPRQGDAAEMAYLELVDAPLVFKTRDAGRRRRPEPSRRGGGGRRGRGRGADDAEAEDAAEDEADGGADESREARPAEAEPPRRSEPATAEPDAKSSRRRRADVRRRCRATALTTTITRAGEADPGERVRESCVSKKRQRITASASSSNATTTSAVRAAAW